MKNSVMLILVSVILFTYCSSSPPVQKYILTPSIENDTETLSDKENTEITIGIGTIEFSEYLKRPEIVTFKGSNELNVDQFNRWAEPLEKNFERVLIENLSRLIPTDRINIFPWQEEEPNSFQIIILVNEFGMRSESSVVLDARWSVSKKFKRDFLMTQRSFYTENAAGVSIEGEVALLSDLIGKFSRDIANEMVNGNE
ncbi:MAG: membrane integrity-associated transporter subunit PqiC [Ignavibacteriaceae bacterium]